MIVGMEDSVSCHNCSLSFGDEQGLEMHLQACPFEWPKVCSGCNACLADLTSLLRHLDIQHNLRFNGIRQHSTYLRNPPQLPENQPHQTQQQQNVTSQPLGIFNWLNDEPKTPVVRSACCMDLGDAEACCDQIAFCPRIFGELDDHSEDPDSTSLDRVDNQQSTVSIVVLDSDLAQMDFDPMLGEIKSHPDEIKRTSMNSSTSNSGGRRRASSSRKDFICDKCNKEFNQKIHLKKHMITAHGGKRPFQCPHCTYSSVDSGHMKVHLRKHTGEKPYLCHICSFKAAQNSTLRQHCAIKHPNTIFHCLWCRAEFFTTYEYERHNKNCKHQQKQSPRTSDEVDSDSSQQHSKPNIVMNGCQPKTSTRSSSTNRKVIC